jgi:hypothetical protein
MKLRRRGLALAVVRDPPDHRVPVNEEDLAGFEIDAGAPVQIGRIADAVSPSPWRVRLRAGRARPSRSRVLHRQAPRPATGGGFQQTSHTGWYEGRPRGYVDRQHHAG